MGRVADVLGAIPGAVLEPGWETRGGAWPNPERVIGVFVHHTAGALGKDAPAFRICRDGRGGPNPVPGPLCNIHIARSGAVTVLAGEKANHAGKGSSVVLADLRAARAPTGDAAKRGLADDATASGETIGIEVEHVGTKVEPWGPQVPALIDVLAHLAEGLDLDPAQIIGHREWTRRKIDPAYAAGIHDVGMPSMAWLREQVASKLDARTPDPGPSLKISEHLPILGPDPLVTVDQAVAYLTARRPAAANGYTSADVRLIVNAYAATARLAGIPLAVVIAQMAHETGFLMSEWSGRPRRNPAGIGVTGQHQDGTPDRPPTTKLPANHQWQWIQSRPDRPADRWEAGVCFPNWAPQSVDAHVGRLAAYAVPVGAETKGQARLIDIAGRWRSIPAAVRGSARTLRELGNAHNGPPPGWASPGTTYGAELAAKIRAMRTT